MRLWTKKETDDLPARRRILDARHQARCAAREAFEAAEVEFTGAHRAIENYLTALGSLAPAAEIEAARERLRAALAAGETSRQAFEQSERECADLDQIEMQLRRDEESTADQQTIAEDRADLAELIPRLLAIEKIEMRRQASRAEAERLGRSVELRKRLDCGFPLGFFLPVPGDQRPLSAQTAHLGALASIARQHPSLLDGHPVAACATAEPSRRLVVYVG